MDLIEAWHFAATRLLPEPAAVWDAHTHTGDRDPDGVRGTAQRLIEKLDTAGQAGAAIMTNQDPTGYGDANDRILAEASGSADRLVPFLRVDPRLGAEAVAEAERSLAAGHRGIKLHPRAEQFTLADPTVKDILRLAADRRVPVLVHSGRGIASLGRDAVELCDAVDGLNLILAHAAISDLSWLGPRIEDHPGLYIDTAWWDITDLLALFAWVPPGRILYASDTPYGHPQLSFVLTMRVAASARYTPQQHAAVFGNNLRHLLDGQAPPSVGPAPGDDFVGGDPGLMRVHASLHGAVVNAFARRDTTEPVSLARLGCTVPDDAHHAPVYRAIAATLDRIDFDGPRSAVVRPLIIAAAAALTPEVSVPELLAGS